jgi:GMP synthase-like glutamine amidotransferase
VSESILWVIDPSVSRPEHQGVERILAGWPGRFHVFRPALSPGDGPSPEDGYGADGIVLMGSAASVHERPEWMEALSRWLRPVVCGDVERPLLAICFGHQLVAHLAGGEVGFNRPDREKRVGVEESEISDNRLLPGWRTLRVVVSHREEVKRPPAGYQIIARRSPIEVDGMQHPDRPIFTFQFHPEAGDEFASHAGIDPARLDARLEGDSRFLLGAFRDLVARRPKPVG